jgi:hypothetical protein
MLSLLTTLGLEWRMTGTTTVNLIGKLILLVHLIILRISFTLTQFHTSLQSYCQNSLQNENAFLIILLLKAFKLFLSIRTNKFDDYYHILKDHFLNESYLFRTSFSTIFSTEILLFKHIVC